MLFVLFALFVLFVFLLLFVLFVFPLLFPSEFMLARALRMYGGRCLVCDSMSMLTALPLAVALFASVLL